MTAEDTRATWTADQYDGRSVLEDPALEGLPDQLPGLLYFGSETA